MTTTSRPSISLPTPLLDAYRRARATPQGASLPGLSTLVQETMAAKLLALGIPVPPTPPPARTAKATAARWSKKSTRDPSRAC